MKTLQEMVASIEVGVLPTPGEVHEFVLCIGFNGYTEYRLRLHDEQMPEAQAIVEKLNTLKLLANCKDAPEPAHAISVPLEYADERQQLMTQLTHVRIALWVAATRINPDVPLTLCRNLLDDAKNVLAGSFISEPPF